MKPSNKAYDFIQKEEGEVLHTYLDSAGIPTIGIGSTMYKDGTKPKKGDVITHEQAMELLRWEVDNKCKSVVAFTQGIALTQNQFDALVSFAYNVGVGALQGSTLLKKVKENPNDRSIVDEFMKWNKITKGGKKISLDSLSKRRAREAALYFSL